MIHIERSVPPAVLEGDDSKAADELRKAGQFFAEPANHHQSYKFEVYRRREVKQQLEDLFHGKCAYCESQYIQTQPMDVEHYRPKGGYVVDGKLRKPGYWWLAAAWSNLLPSCIDCNRRRTQEFLDDVERASGKANLFPILHETHRARVPGAEGEETRLLLDPCRDRPEELLEFDEGGVVRPKADLDALDQRRAEESIRTYGLDRRRLNEARREKRTLILNQYHALLGALRQFKAAPQDDSARRRLATALGSFRRFRRPDQVYALMARQMIDPVADRIRSSLFDQLAADLPALPGAPDDLLERFVEAYEEQRRTPQDFDAELAEILGG